MQQIILLSFPVLSSLKPPHSSTYLGFQIELVELIPSMASHNHMEDNFRLGILMTSILVEITPPLDVQGNLLKVEETAPGAATGMILSLRESLQDCKDNLASSQTELESAKSEIQKWRSAFEKEPFIPPGMTPVGKSKEKGGCIYCNFCQKRAGDSRVEGLQFGTLELNSSRHLCRHGSYY